MSRLVVVSNRVADVSKEHQSGGLAVAVGDALRKTGGLWFGWDGEIADPSTHQQPHIQETNNVALVTVPLSQEEYDNYYLGFANSVLWPLLHYRLDLVEFDVAYLHTYRSVNQRFANVLSGYLKPDDIIWVHDYHLIPFGAELRTRGLGQRLGFFLHIPFPPPDIFVAITEYEWLIRCIFSYDVIGFQTQIDLENFQRVVEDLAHGEVHGDGTVSAYGRTIIAKKYPIGIDVGEFHQMAADKNSRDIIDALQRRTLASMQIIGVDRLDYSKGLPERFRAFREFLTLYPENRKGVTLMQIAPPTREDVDAYADIRTELEGLSGSINGEFGDFDWTPIRYIHRNVPRATLAALFRGSKMGLVTPLRDGMNLVAKEYVAAQDADDPGVLVLSKFAGAAEDLSEALIVNPYDAHELAENLQRAATMSCDERRERHAALFKKIKQNDIVHWRQSFLADLSPDTFK